MQLNDGGEIKERRADSPATRQTWVRLSFVLGLTILYSLFFHPITEIAGPVGAALISIPVALAGWYFGINAGLIASLLGIILSAVLLQAIFTGDNWFLRIANYWPGNLMVVLVGFIAGRLQKELAGRTRALDELRSRERYLTLVNMTIRDILNPGKFADRYYYLITHLVNLFVADYAHLVHWDAAQKQAVVIASTSLFGQPFSDIVIDSSESSITASVLQTGHTLVIDDVPNSDYASDPALIINLSPPTRSVLCIPLIAGENKLGAVIIAYNTPHHFTSKEIEHAELTGSQISLVFYTIQQELKIQKQLKEANALANIGRVLSETERVGIETVLQLIVDSARELIPEAENAVLHLLDEDQQTLIPRAVAGFAPETKTKLYMRLGEGVAGQVIMRGEVIAVSDTEIDPRFLNQATPVKFRSLVVAPVQGNERCVGTISIQSQQPNVFTPDESTLLGALGTQAAIAIENANLLETTQQDLKEINALYHVSRGLVASLDPDQLMKEVVNLLQHNFGYYHVQTFVMDLEGDGFIARNGSGKIGDQLRERGYRIPLGAGIIGHVAETGIPFVTNNVDDVVFFIRNPLLPDTQSELTVPIKVENQVVGVLDIQQEPPGHLTSRDMQLMTAVADQLAVALQKANLYADLQTSLNQEKAMRSQLIQSERLAVIGRLLASVSHELNNPLQAIQNALFLIKEEEKLSVQGRQDLEIILSETERMTILIDRLRTTFRPTRTEDFQDVQLNNIIEDTYALTATHMRHKKISFEFLPDPELPTVPAIPDQIRQVALNLFMNAVEAMQTGGHLTVRAQQLTDQDKILFSVTDTGPGIDPEFLPHIFEPFVTSKETGTGLGLTITYDIIRQHGGDIQAENNPQGGAAFKVWLPIHKRTKHGHLR